MTLPKTSSLRSLGSLLVVVAIAAWVHAVAPPAQDSGEAPDVVVVPFLVDAARELVVVDGNVLVANTLPDERPVFVRGIEIEVDGIVLAELFVEDELASDPRYGELNAMIERMPLELTELRRPRAFASGEAAPYAPEEVPERWGTIQNLVTTLRAEYAAGRPRPFVEHPFRLPLDQVFHPEDPAGTEREVVLRVRWQQANGPLRTTSASHTLRRLAPALPAPASLGSRLGFSLSEVTLHSGDLHVHSCHGEAVNACAPSTDCDAESFQTSGSFTYAQLKSQYQALGIDWFTATDHSYCINSDSEYTTIVGEIQAITEAAFLAIPDIELSSDEEGPQIGSDAGDLACLGTTQANHMGAHGISARIEGGSDGFLGFCDGLFSDALDGFSANVAEVRAQGGYPIINHPDSSFGWNSFQNTTGIEAKQLHGVEIWNSATQSGQTGPVEDWIDWLLAGRILYAYSGSDTHDAVFAFGANHAVFLGEPFDQPNLERILKAGRVFLSNGHVLILEIEYDGQSVLMGGLQALPPGQAASSVTVRAHYDFGTDSSTITFFRGRVGDAAETTLTTSALLTGQGIFEFTDTLDPANRTWYRAYSDSNAGAITAYTNPVFFLPGSCSYVPYGVGAGGANIATLDSASSPTIGSVNKLDLSGFDPLSPVAILGYSTTQLPSGVPLAGGFLFIGPPFLNTVNVLLTGGAGSFVATVPPDASLVGQSFYWQAGAPDGNQVSNVAFSNGLAMTVCDLLE